MIFFTGDICLCDKAFDVGFGIGSKISKKGFHPFEKLLKKEGDIWVGNYEGVVSDVSNNLGNSASSFRIDSDTLSKSGSIIDYWGVANNHVMEHGEEAYTQMIGILSKKSKGTFGGNQFRSVVFEHKRKNVSLTAFSLRTEETGNEPQYWHLPDLSAIQDEYNKIKDSDYRIAYIHWGVEYVDYPYTEQVKLAHWLVDVGFNLIIGMHPHVLQGFEIYKGKHIFYSLGNFVFNMAYEPSKYSVIVKLDVENNDVGFDYVHLDQEGRPEIINEEQVPEAFRFSTLNAKIGKEENIEKYINKYHRGLKAYRKSNNKYILSNLFNYRLSFFTQMIASFLKRRLHYAH